MEKALESDIWAEIKYISNANRSTFIARIRIGGVSDFLVIVLKILLTKKSKIYKKIFIALLLEKKFFEICILIIDNFLLFLIPLILFLD